MSLWSRIANVFRGDRLIREIDEELESHIEEAIAHGRDPAEARRSFGPALRHRERSRDIRLVPFLDNRSQDLRFALRQLRKNPAFTGTAILMLGLGLCASIAIFAFVDAALIKPLPYRDPARLVGVFESVQLFPRSNLSYADYLDWKQLNKSFSSLDAYNRTGFMLRTAAGAEAARGARVTDGFFRTLGVAPVLGRDFRPGEDLASAPRTVMLSYAAWQNRYGGKPDVVGQTVTLNGEPNIIIGVLPRDFHFAPAEPAEFWAALHPNGPCELRRSCHNLYGVARLKDGVSLETALADVTSIARMLEQQYPDSNRGQGAALASLADVIGGDVRGLVLALLGGALLLLVIATVNVTSLLLVRSESRRREIAVRNALGAGSARLIGQFVTESLVLVAAGTAVGLTSAHFTMRLLAGLIPAPMFASMSYLRGLGLNVRVLAFAGAAALLAALVFSVTPALRLSRSDMREGLAEGGRGSAGNAWRRLGSKLVVAELAIAMVLLVSAGLLGKSLYQLLRVDVGLQPEHMATIDVAAPKSAYATDAQALALARLVVRRIESLPGVQSVGICSQVPVSSNGNTTWFRVLGRPHHGEHYEAPERQVSPAYFTTVGARLFRGRYFTEAEDASKPRVAIINRALARQHFPGEDPVGKQLTYLSEPPVPLEIAGVVEDIKEGPLDTPVPPVIYIPFNQSPDRYFSVVVRTAGAEQSLLPEMASIIRQVNPGIVTSRGMSMRDRIHDSYSAALHRSSAWLVGGFAALALLMGIVGLYGVVAYSISQRTREIGIRMALGARPLLVYRLVLKEAASLIVAGLVIGIGCSMAAGKLIRGLLFGVHAWDVATLGAVAAGLGVCALLASYFPARRAASVNPVDALRAE